MGRDDVRERIVRRRAHFVAGSLAGAGMVALHRTVGAQDVPSDAAQEAGEAGVTEPEVCLCACETVGTPSTHAALFPIVIAGVLASARRRL
jgi:hypothetical protein